MKRLAILSLILISSAICAQPKTVCSPDGRLKVTVTEDAMYSVLLDGKTILNPSRLGLNTNRGDFSDARMTEAVNGRTAYDYNMNSIKKSSVRKEANTLICTFSDSFKVEFRVSDTDVAFRYIIDNPSWAGITILEEKTTFNFPAQTTTFLTSQCDAMSGWRRTKPSYEEHYALDRPLTEKSEYGNGFTFPCLFKIGEDGWALVCESGTCSQYCGCRLLDWKEGGFQIGFPMPGENDGLGSAEPAFSLPGSTPWRTIAVGSTLEPVAESTVTWDVAEQLYEPGTDYKYGRSTWSWLLWQDGSINWDDQVAYIDLAHELGYQYVLIDNFWDKNIGHDKMEELIRYANSRNVDVFLWYSSSGYWNDIYQSPVNLMENPIVRKKEMKWLKENNVKGIKVDFFAGDKQETLRLYEAILSDANDYGLMCIFHGATIPRGWEKMYPNYVSSEAVRSSENLVFGQEECDIEAQNATILPFVRNATGSMDFGGTILHRHLSRDNEHGTLRRTTDDFELATAVLFQSPVQNFALAPDDIVADSLAYAVDFMREVPVTWDDIRFIDGYPGKYAVIAREKDGVWYVAAVNAEQIPYQLDLNAIASMFNSPASVSVLHGGRKSEKIINYKAKARSKAYKSGVISLTEGDGAVIVIN
ncbi:MAG: glycoside hydrolase family 97 protein [Bacteroidales bacterium]|nr:glycoside hydrolase family 97 protein [Bacteroidales bacterium]